MSPRRKHADSVIEPTSDEPEVEPDPLPPGIEPAAAPAPDTESDQAWQEKCPCCESYDLTWWPAGRVPNVGEKCIRRCRGCRQSRLVKRLR